MPHVAWIAHTRRSVRTVQRAVSCPTFTLDLPYLVCERDIHPSSVYLDRVAKGETGWPLTSLVDGIPDIENVTEALEHGPYGKCVYERDNDVCDNQVRTMSLQPRRAPRLLTDNVCPPKVVNIQYASGATASFTMVAYTSLTCIRQTRLHFTHGEIVGDMNQFTVTDFRTGQSTVHRSAGGDGYPGLMKTFVEAVRTRRQDLLGIDVTDILRSHSTTIAAEHSRKTRTVVDCSEFENVARCAWSGGVQNLTAGT